MPIVVEAVYEDGVLKPDTPLPLGEHARVHVTVEPVNGAHDPLAEVIGICDGLVDGAANHDKYIYGEIKK